MELLLSHPVESIFKTVSLTNDLSADIIEYNFLKTSYRFRDKSPPPPTHTHTHSPKICRFKHVVDIYMSNLMRESSKNVSNVL